MKRQRKPIGSIGPVSISDEDGVTFDRVEFPGTKDEVESFVVELTIRSFQEGHNNPWGVKPERNPESHFDFTLPTSEAIQYLDLMEVAPLEGTGGYQRASLEHNHGELADWVWNKITQKAQHYGLPRKEDVHLLLYSTDVAFRLSEPILEILSYYCVKVDRGFKSILYSVPENKETAFTYLVHPRSPEEFRGFNLRAKRERKSLVGDLTSFSAVDGQTVRISLGGRRGDKGK